MHARSSNPLCIFSRNLVLPRHSHSVDGDRHRLILGEVVAHIPGALAFAFSDGSVLGFLKYDAVFRIVGICAFDNPEWICCLCATLRFELSNIYVIKKHLRTTARTFICRANKKSVWDCTTAKLSCFKDIGFVGHSRTTHVIWCVGFVSNSDKARHLFYSTHRNVSVRDNVKTAHASVSNGWANTSRSPDKRLLMWW